MFGSLDSKSAMKKNLWAWDSCWSRHFKFILCWKMASAQNRVFTLKGFKCRWNRAFFFQGTSFTHTLAMKEEKCFGENWRKRINSTICDWKIPCNQGIIKCLKMHYPREMVRKTNEYFDKKILIFYRSIRCHMVFEKCMEKGKMYYNRKLILLWRIWWIKRNCRRARWGNNFISSQRSC